jgi:gas vesicle protein
MRAVYTVGTFLAAAAMGACAALLFAPQSGKRTRRLLRRRAEDYARDVHDGIATAQELCSRRTEGARQMMSDLGRKLPRFEFIGSR